MPKKSFHEKFMRVALKEAYLGIKRERGGPFGCCIVKNNKVITKSHNKVLKTNDPTAHAEINAIKKASKLLKRFSLKGCTLYTTTEPCPMCFSAIHWAQINEVIYGTGISDVRRLGFNELNISAKNMKKLGQSKVKITSGILINECKNLLSFWKKSPPKKIY